MFVTTLGVLALVWLYVWMSTRDPFHPLIYILPQCMFLYAWLPLSAIGEDPVQFRLYAGGDFLYAYHALVVGLIASMIAGVLIAARGPSGARARWRTLHVRNGDTLRLVALGLALAGLAAFLYGISLRGGFASAYGSGHGGGGGSGYVRELRYLGLIGIPLVYLTRAGKTMRPQDWALLVLCVAPTLTHGLLGARRGPTFLALVVLGGGYVFFMRKRISLVVLASGGVSVGLLLLFLVANRNSIYLGSELTSFRSPLAVLERWSSNEYLIGSAYVRYANAEGPFYGVRELTHLIARFLPTFVWPDVYADLPRMFGHDFKLWLNGGVDPVRVSEIVGWTPSVGAAEGFAASLWLEFGIFSFPAAFLIGMLYGRVWRAARDSVPARLVYLLMVALSIYLVMQNLDPWLYRLLLLGGPAYVLGRMIRVRKEAPVQPAAGPVRRRRVASPAPGTPYEGPPGHRLTARAGR